MDNRTDPASAAGNLAGRAIQTAVLSSIGTSQSRFRRVGQNFWVMSIVGESKLGIMKELSGGPSHGYDIAEDVEISHEGVYTHLKELEEEDLIEMVKQEDDKKIYRLTGNGQMLLEALGELD